MPVAGCCQHHCRHYCCYNNAQPVRAAPRTQQCLGAPLRDASAVTCPTAQVRSAQPDPGFSQGDRAKQWHSDLGSLA